MENRASAVTLSTKMRTKESGGGEREVKLKYQKKNYQIIACGDVGRKTDALPKLTGINGPQKKYLWKNWKKSRRQRKENRQEFVERG